MHGYISHVNFINAQLAADAEFAGKVSWTPLIPMFVGLPLAIAGALALKESLRMHAMHGAAAVGLLGFIGGTGNLIRVAIAGEKTIWDPGVSSTVALALICGSFVGLCVNSFVQARLAREKEQAQGGTSGTTSAPTA
jgi:hypothetical protein